MIISYVAQIIVANSLPQEVCTYYYTTRGQAPDLDRLCRLSVQHKSQVFFSVCAAEHTSLIPASLHTATAAFTSSLCSLIYILTRLF